MSKSVAGRSNASRRPVAVATSPVSHDRFVKEAIRKEEAHIRPYSNFFVSPYNMGHTITGKLNSFQEAEADLALNMDTTMLDTIQDSRKKPREKYEEPVTSSQEYGWISESLLDPEDVLDPRIYHGKFFSDVTKIEEEQLKIDKTNPRIAVLSEGAAFVGENRSNRSKRR